MLKRWSKLVFAAEVGQEYMRVLRGRSFLPPLKESAPPSKRQLHEFALARSLPGTESEAAAQQASFTSIAPPNLEHLFRCRRRRTPSQRPISPPDPPPNLWANAFHRQISSPCSASFHHSEQKGLLHLENNSATWNFNSKSKKLRALSLNLEAYVLSPDNLHISSSLMGSDDQRFRPSSGKVYWVKHGNVDVQSFDLTETPAPSPFPTVVPGRGVEDTHVYFPDISNFRTYTAQADHSSPFLAASCEVACPGRSVPSSSGAVAGWDSDYTDGLTERGFAGEIVAREGGNRRKKREIAGGRREKWGKKKCFVSIKPRVRRKLSVGISSWEMENKSNKKDRKMDDGIFVTGRVSLSTRISGWFDD
ncbi:hypothetical protein YC2023_067260 [Brassica napus]